MVYELTSPDVKPEFYPPQDVSVSSSRQEISVSEFLIFRKKPFEKPFFTLQNLSPIMQIDSSSMYPFFGLKNETALTDEFFRKIEKLKVLEDVSGMLNELTSEQMKIFETAVKRRPLFK